MIVAIILICKADFGLAQSFFTAGPEGLGDAGRAAVNPVDSHYLNPAGLAVTKDYNGGVVYQMARPSLENPQSGFAAVVTDNSPDNIAAAGFGYAYKRSSFPDHTIVDQDFSLSIAEKIFPTVFVGVQGRRLVRQNSIASGFVKHNLAVGALVVPESFLGIAFVAYDILNDDDLDMVPVLSLGTHIIILDIMRIRADVTRQEKKNPDKAGTLNLGLELNSNSGFLIRTGGEWDTLNHATFFTAGLSWEGPRLSVSYAYKTNVNVAGDSTHTFQAQLPF